MQPEYTPADIERFHHSYRESTDPDGCWVWTGSIHRRYGYLPVTAGERPSRVQAHRFAYLLYHGPAPDGVFIRHTCGNGKCVRPGHLVASNAAVTGWDAAEHFHRSYRKSDEPDGCWEWITVRGNRYGQTHVFDGARLVRIGAHRLSYTLHYGPIPDGLIVRHACDNRRCVRPDHLLVGTHADNAQDKVDRGRHTFGARVNTAKLNEDAVREIRGLWDAGWNATRIARAFGVSRANVYSIVQRQNWKHVE